MRTSILAAAVLLLVPVSAASASIVIHDGQPGVVATTMYSDGYSLDSDGHAWWHHAGTWIRDDTYDTPMPVENIKLWEARFLFTTDNHLWVWGPQHNWSDNGLWPASAVPETTAATLSASPKTIPNPSAGPCRVAFQTATAGPVSVSLFDASGRLVRQLHDGSLPAGEFSLSWDGRDDGGQKVPAGVYFAKVITSAGENTTRLVLAR